MIGVGWYRLRSGSWRLGTGTIKLTRGKKPHQFLLQSSIPCRRIPSGILMAFKWDIPDWPGGFDRGTRASAWDDLKYIRSYSPGCSPIEGVRLMPLPLRSLQNVGIIHGPHYVRSCSIGAMGSVTLHLQRLSAPPARCSWSNTC